jgi:DnaA family protein
MPAVKGIPDMAAASSGASPLFTQLPLGVRLRDEATFANYYPGVNQEAVRLLQDAAAQHDGVVYLWGGPGTGKTHLLQAICHLAAAEGQALAYLPLREAASFSPELVEGLEQLPLVIVDDIDTVAGNPVWETALFHLYNRIREQGGRLILSGSSSPAAIAIALPDLRSRLAGGLVLQLRALPDDDKAAALRLQARRRGMEMPEEVAVYLLRRCPRDMADLFALLETLDQASLAAQRKLTIPFVKTVLETQFRV